MYFFDFWFWLSVIVGTRNCILLDWSTETNGIGVNFNRVEWKEHVLKEFFVFCFLFCNFHFILMAKRSPLFNINSIKAAKKFSFKLMTFNRNSFLLTPKKILFIANRHSNICGQMIISRSTCCNSCQYERSEINVAFNLTDDWIIQ